MRRQELSDVKGFLVDLDGTTYLGNSEIPGARDFFDILKQKKIPYLFFSNNPSKDVSEYVTKLKRFGIKATEDQFVTSRHVTIDYLRSKLAKKLYVLGNSSFEREMVAAGFELAEKHVDYIVVSFDQTLTYHKLEVASYLVQQGVPYIATNPDVVCPTEDGFIPDCGSITALIETATQVKPERVLGKPGPEIIAKAVEKIGLRTSELALIGDRLYTDIKMGHNAGVTTILVLSGETKKSDVPKSELKPDYVVDSVFSLKL
jgi:HAD superfamily hydrolase (TIGR01457 family)